MEAAPDAPSQIEVPAVWMSRAELERLAREARDVADAVVHKAKVACDDEKRALEQRIKQEQDRLFAQLTTALPAIVKAAAEQGHRHAVLCAFDGGDKFDEFCTLYLLKGPRDRQERKELDVVPVLNRLHRMVRGTGFSVAHAWQRATNHNEVTITW